jgi:hypothetical protein
VTARRGTITVKVTDYDTARQRVLTAALAEGAEIRGAHTAVNFQGKKHGWLRLRFPAERLHPLLEAIRTVGKLYAEEISAAEFASEHGELGRRAERLREHRERLAGLLETRRRLRGSDLLYLQERLFRAGIDEGVLRQRRLDMERAARVSHLTVELFEPEPRRVMDLGNWYAGAALRARTALYRILARGTTVGAYALYFAPFWLPGLVIALLLLRAIWRRGRPYALWLAATAARALQQRVARWFPPPAGPTSAAG